MLSETEGAVVDLVVPRGPADEAGLWGRASMRNKRASVALGESGDLITAIDGVKVRSVADLASYLAESGRHVGDLVTLRVVRNARVLEVSVRLSARDDKQGDLVGAI